MSVSAAKRKRRIARDVARARAPRMGLMLGSAVAPNREVYVEHYNARAVDSRAPRDGGRQTWHDRANARPWQTSTGFTAIRPNIAGYTGGKGTAS